MYRKFKADRLFTGSGFAGNNKVLVVKNNGTIEAIIDEEDTNDIETFSGIICPGFINAHCHLELSHMKGMIPEKTGLVDFVYRVVNNRYTNEGKDFTNEQMAAGVETAENEMLANGIVAVGDICNNLLTHSQKKKEKLAYYNFIEASGWLPAISQTRFERTLNLYREFSMAGANCSIVPHAPYSVSEKLWQLINPWFRDKAVSIHNQETIFEDEFFLEGTGDLVRMYQLMNIDNSHHQASKRSSLQTYFDKLSGAASNILVHNTFIKQEDIDFIKLQKQYPANDPGNYSETFFCICINANRYIENTLPPIEMLIRNNCTIILGTDSLASNWSLNLLDEMKTVQDYFPGITLVQMLEWATLNGAKALMMDNSLGNFEKGKRPGIILIENVEGEKLKTTSSVKRIL